MVMDLLQLPDPRDPAWLAVLVVLLVLSLLLSVSWRPLVWYEWRHLPGNKPYGALFSRHKKWDVAAQLLVSGRKHGRHVYKVWVGSTPCAVVNQPELAHHLCMRNTERFGGHPAQELLMLQQPSSTILDEGVLLSNGMTWRQARRAFELTVMQPKSLAGHQRTIQEHADRLCDLMATHCAEGTYCNILQEFSAMSMAVMGSAAYGGDFTLEEEAHVKEAGKKLGKDSGGKGSKHGQGSASANAEQQPRKHLVAAVTQLVQQAPRILEIGSPLMLRALAMPQLQPALQWLLHRSPDAKFLAHSKLCKEVLLQGRALLTSEKEESLSFRPGAKAAGDLPPCTSSGGTSREDSVLGQLLEARSREKDKSRRLTDEQVLAQPLALMMAGCSPTATTLALCIYMLCKHPFMEMKVMDEVDTVLKRRAAHNSRSAPATPTGSTRGLVLKPEGQATGLQSKQEQQPKTSRLSMDAPSSSQQESGTAEGDAPSGAGNRRGGGGAGGEEASGERPAVNKETAGIQAQRQRSLQVPVNAGQGTVLSELLADDLPFTEAVVKEVLRLFPPVPFLRRQAPADGMDIDGVKVPGNAALLIPVANFHRDEKYFPQPEQFRPERFLELRGPGLHETLMLKNLAPTTPYAYIPFGVGGRMCVGYKYALVHITVVLAALYSRYTFRLQPGQEPLPIHSSILTAPDNGVWVKVQERPKFSTDDIISPR